MGILDKLKLKRTRQQPDMVPKTEPVVETPRPAGRSGLKQPVKTAARRAGQAVRYLRRPILSEKATALAAKGQYLFAVANSANKQEIKNSIQGLYGVTVERVNIINLPGKTRRYGRTRGRTSDWKKAVVTVKAGQKIPGFLET